MATSKKQTGTTTAIEVGAGLLAAAAAAGATYYFYGDQDAKKHRASATKWARGMKADVLKEAKKLPKLDAKTMAGIVDKAAAVYGTARSANKEDIAAASRELKKQWKRVQDEIQNLKGKTGATKNAAKSTSTTTKKAARTSASTVKKAAAPKKSAPKRAKRAS